MRPLAWRLLAFVSLALGSACLGALGSRFRHSPDRGLASLIPPLAIFFLYSCNEYLRDVCSLSGLESPGLYHLSVCIRLFLGLGWALCSHRHYAIYGQPWLGRRLNPLVIALSLTNAILYLVLVFGFRREGLAYAICSWVAAFTCLYAGISAFLLLRWANRLLPSSIAGLRISGLSLLIYPMGLVGELLGFRYPFIGRGQKMWELSYPAYGVLMYALAIFALAPRRRGGGDPSPELGGAPGFGRGNGGLESLSRRERGVAALLAQDLSYKEISRRLGISPETVKSHAVGAYRKLGVKSQADLRGLIIGQTAPRAGQDGVEKPNSP